MDYMELVWHYCPDCDEEYNLPEDCEACPICDSEELEQL